LHLLLINNKLLLIILLLLRCVWSLFVLFSQDTNLRGPSSDVHICKGVAEPRGARSLAACQLWCKRCLPLSVQLQVYFIFSCTWSLNQSKPIKMIG